MTRINVGYLIALGLLGTAAACKYSFECSNRERLSRQIASGKSIADNLTQRPNPLRSLKASKKSTQTHPSLTACETPKSRISKPKTPPRQHHPTAAPQAAQLLQHQLHSPKSQPSPRQTAASTQRRSSTARCRSQATCSRSAAQNISSAECE